MEKEAEAREHVEVVREVVAARGESANLVSTLLEIQKRLGYLSREAMLEVSRLLDVSETTIYGVATFYNRFRFVPLGKRHVQVCMGTACHVKRGEIILDSWKRRLNINEGETTEDREYSLDRVACVGCCVMAPVTVINNEVRGGMTTSTVDGILLSHEIERERKKKGDG